MNDGYEFNDKENDIIARAAWWSTALAVVLAIGAVDALRVHYAVAAVHTIVAIALAYVGHRLRLVVQTEGNDVELFLQSLDGIGGAFGMRLIATAIALVSAALMYGVFLALIQG